MPDVLLHGDTERSAALRHEVPVAIVDPFAYVERDGRATILTNPLERARIAAARPDAELVLTEELGMFELFAQGIGWREAEVELTARLVARVGLERVTVPDELPVAVADRLRADGVVVEVDGAHFADRRRCKSDAELAGIRRAQRAAEAAMAAAAALLRGASVGDDGLLHHDGVVLTADRVREELRATCARHGAPAPPDIMVTSHLSGGGHDPGTGPLPAHRPITIDLWPRDEASSCSADMTRTFVVGDVSPEVAGLRDVVRDALERARAAVRPGVLGRDLYAVAAQVVEDAGFPTQRTRRDGETLDHGFYFSLGHGVGLEVHEEPGLGLSGGHPLVVGDVLALEPGIENLPGIGGVRYEDLVLVTADGCETLTDFPYDLTP